MLKLKWVETINVRYEEVDDGLVTGLEVGGSLKYQH